MDISRYGWHILSEDRRLQFHDGRKVRVGLRLQYRVYGERPVLPKDRIKLCRRGMHASPTIHEAICLCPRSSLNNGGWLCRVLIEETRYGPSRNRIGSIRKFVGTHRTVLGMIPLSKYYALKTEFIGQELVSEVKHRMEVRNVRNRSCFWAVP